MLRFIALAIAAALLFGACGSSNAPALLLVHYDGGEGGADAGSEQRQGLTPDGEIDATDLGGPCVDDAQCDDMIACTYDSCDETVGRCLNVPDSTQCQDGNYCDGQEQCVLGHGCEPGPVVSCDNGKACETATCVEATMSCQYAPRDIDQDGDPDEACPPGHDCNDLDPNVSSLHAEVCANGIDDNCNGQIDEQPCVEPEGDTCASPLAFGQSGNYQVSTLGNTNGFATSCSVSKPASSQAAVGTVTVPPGGPADVEIWVTSTVEVAVAIDGRCGAASSELTCASAPGATSVRARAYSVSPGAYDAVVITQSPNADVEVQVALLPPTPPPANVTCSTATPLTPGTPLTVSIVDPLPTNLPTACPAATGQLTYSFTLAQPQDVHVYASTVRGSGSPVVGLRDPGCTQASDELACEVAGGAPIFEATASAGTYTLTLAGTSPIDATLEVVLSAPTPPAANQSCASPPAVMQNGTVSFDLADHESAIKDGCAPSGPDAAYDLQLAAASDVLLIERIPQNESGGVSLDGPSCQPASRQACEVSSTPVRVGRRNVPAGDYRAVVSDQYGLSGTLDTLWRNTVAPTVVPSGGAATCATAIDATAGGFFTGDTSTVGTSFTSACDAPGNGEHVQLLSLDLKAAQRVVLDMEGSTYQTLLDVRQGACPGTPVENGCYVGFDPPRSFLNLELPAGQYSLLVSGYSGGEGPWDLDVRVLPP